MSAPAPVASVIRVICAALLLPTAWQTAAIASVPWSQEAGSTRALLVAADSSTATELNRVAEVLQHAYGVAPDGIVRISGEAARTDDIERRLADHAMRARPRDTVIIVLALALHDKGRDRILMTSDFDPARPWSGLSLDLLRKISAASSAESLWLFVPGCAPPSKASAGRQAIPSGPNARSAYGGRALITFCESEGASPGRRFVQLLAQTLRESALSATKRGSVEQSGVAGIVTADELLDRLVRIGEDIRFRADSSLGGGAILRVRVSAAEANASELRTSLYTAADDEAAIGVLDRAVKSGRSASDPSDATAIAGVLANYALDATVDTTRRARAIQALGALPAGAARPALERIFATAVDGQLRAGALREWVRAADRGDLRLVKQALGESDPLVQIAAIQAVAASDDRDSADAVLNALKTAGDVRVRVAAARALTSIADNAFAEEMLTLALSDTSELVRAEVASALGRLMLSAQAAAPLMTLAIGDPSALVRENACYAVAATWPRLAPADLELIERQLMDIASGPDVNAVRIAALYSLARSGFVSRDNRIVSIARSRKTTIEVRKAAIEAIGQLQMASAVKPLAQIARDSEETTELRVAATAALGRMPTTEAGDALWNLSLGDPVDVAAVARRTIEQGCAFSPATAATATATDSEQVPTQLRVAAVRALASSKDPRAIDPLINALVSSALEVRESAIAGLARFKDVAAVSRIANVLAVRSETGGLMREGSTLALAAMDTDQAREILERHADDPDTDVRRGVAAGLGTARPTASGYAALERLSRDENERVRTAAAVSLGRVENFRASGRLEELAKDKDPDVRAAAVEALRTVRSRELGTAVEPPR